MHAIYDSLDYDSAQIKEISRKLSGELSSDPSLILQEILKKFLMDIPYKHAKETCDSTGKQGFREICKPPEPRAFTVPGFHD